MAVATPNIPTSQIHVGGSSTGASRRKSVAWWKEQIRQGLNFMEDYGYSQEWTWYRQWYRHRFRKGTLPYNLLFSHAKQIADRVLVRLPRVLVSASRPGFEVHARVIERLDNRLLKSLGVKNQLRRMLIDSFLCGNGYGFDGYDAVFGFDPDKFDPLNPDQTLSMIDRRGNFNEYHRHVRPGMPWFLRARPDDVIWPWGTVDKENAPWVAQRIFRPLDDLKRDPKYGRLSGLRGTHAIKRTTSQGTSNSVEGQEPSTGVDPNAVTEWVEFFQVHDLETGKLFALAMDHPSFLRDTIDFTQMGALPVHALTPNEDSEWVYGIPDARIIEPQQREINDVKLQLMKHRRVAIIKLLYRGDSIKPAEIEKMLDEDVKAAVRVNADVEVALDNVVKHIQSQVPPDLQPYAEQIKTDAREIMRLGPNQLAGFLGKTHISSRETGEVAQGSAFGADARQEDLNDVLIRVVKRFNMYVFRHWTQNRVEEVVGPFGARTWVRFTGPEIAHDYVYEIDPAPPEVRSRRQRKTEALELMRSWREANPPDPNNPASFRLPEEIQRFIFSQYEEINVDKLLAQIGFPPPGMGTAIPGAPLTIGDVISLEQQALKAGPTLKPAPTQASAGNIKGGTSSA